jgi:hypothetical protein
MEELTSQLGWGKDPNQLREVWSSKDGVVGRVYGHVTDLSRANTVIAYSDGLENVEDSIRPDLSPPELENLILQSQAVKDDDATFLEVTAGSTDIPGLQDDIVDMLRTVNTVAPHPAGINDPETAKHMQTLDALQKKYETQKASANRQRQMLLVATGLIAALCFVGGLLTSAVAPPILFKPTITATPTSTLTVTASPSQTPSSTPSLTETPTATATATETATFIPTLTASSTAASASPGTDTATPTLIYTGTPVTGTSNP